MCSEEHDTTRNKTQMWKPYDKDRPPAFTCSGKCGRILADCSKVYKVKLIRRAMNKDGIQEALGSYCHECAQKRGITND